jgi:hypothetical protein
VDVKRTLVAGQAVGLAELFRFTVGQTVLEGSTRYAVEMSAPEGESTGGGKAALQHIVLRPTEGSGATIVIGTAHAASKRAELRTFRNVDAAHRRRFGGAPLDVDRAAFDQLQASLAAFFDGRQFQVAFDDGPATAPGADEGAEPASRPGRVPAKGIVAAAVAAALVVLVTVLLRR